jgi:hypothetical protein
VEGVGTNRGGAALGGAVLMLVLLRVTLRLARQGNHFGRVAVVVDLVLLAALVVYAVSQNRRSG